MAVNSAGGEPCLGRGHALPMQGGMRKGLQCLWPNELLDSGYMGAETGGKDRET